ncbi:hypothetical protein BO71DRAFT_461090 [Aspergillus ellipticus CBS 707.79]|uniref:Uncharacterized protein n=1 Tax=Aspergillus ellipticus CBS 707.79 TaxID=1448320 RepID=A0A319D049_9EURO|nr:hypothetical protein BO71DRAFT_461090 [Aspergillus ellipticus CBS 707.79]
MNLIPSQEPSTTIHIETSYWGLFSGYLSRYHYPIQTSVQGFVARRCSKLEVNQAYNHTKIDVSKIAIKAACQCYPFHAEDVRRQIALLFAYFSILDDALPLFTEGVRLFRQRLLIKETQLPVLEAVRMLFLDLDGYYAFYSVDMISKGFLDFVGAKTGLVEPLIYLIAPKDVFPQDEFRLLIQAVTDLLLVSNGINGPHGDTRTTVRCYREFDLFDDEAHFQLTAVKRALASPLLMSAICALTARQISMVGKGEVWKSVAVQYYGDSLLHLIAALDSPTSSLDDTLAATILLSSYELLASPGLDHRRHVYGALNLIRTHDCNASSGGLIGAAFWAFARHDVAIALVHECPTMLPPEEWDVAWAEQETREDRRGNKMVWLLARIIAHTFQTPDGRTQDTQSLLEHRTSLLHGLEAWHASLPDTFRGMAFGPPSEEGFLPQWFAVPSTVGTNLGNPYITSKISWRP